MSVGVADVGVSFADAFKAGACAAECTLVFDSFHSLSLVFELCSAHPPMKVHFHEWHRLYLGPHASLLIPMLKFLPQHIERGGGY
jgi:hypothetical protein